MSGKSRVVRITSGLIFFASQWASALVRTLDRADRKRSKTATERRCMGASLGFAAKVADADRNAKGRIPTRPPAMGQACAACSRVASRSRMCAQPPLWPSRAPSVRNLTCVSAISVPSATGDSVIVTSLSARE